MPRPKISAVVCTFNRYEWLKTCLDSLFLQDLPQEAYEIIVVDNTTDDLVDYKARDYLKQLSRVEYIIERIPGLSNARNVGYEAAKSEIVAYIDDDARAKTEWLQNLLKSYERFGENSAIVGGKIIPIWPYPRPSWVHELMLPSLTVVDWGGSPRIAKAEEWLAGANISFRKSYLEAIGGFSKTLGRTGTSNSLLSNEEFDAVVKIEKVGGLRIYTPEAEVEHLIDERRVNHQWFRKRAAWQAVSDYIMNSAAAEQYSMRSLDDLLEFLSSLPPEERRISGIYNDNDHPGITLSQINAIYSLVISALSGFKRNDKNA